MENQNYIGVFGNIISDSSDSLSEIPSYLRVKPTMSLEETLTYYKMKKDYINSLTMQRESSNTIVSDLGGEMMTEVKLNGDKNSRSRQDFQFDEAFSNEKKDNIWRSFAKSLKTLPMQYVLDSMAKTYSSNLGAEPEYAVAADIFKSCPVLRPAVNYLSRETVCTLLSFVVEYFSSSPPALMGILNQKRYPGFHEKSSGAAMKLPYPYQHNFMNNQNIDEKKVPFIIPMEIADQEKTSFYWYYSTLLNFWSYVGQCRNAKYDENKPYPPVYEFGNNNYHNLAVINDAHLPLISALYNENEEHLVLLIRGSALKVDWDMNFDYKLATEEFTRDVGKLEGRVHNGFLMKTLEIRDEIEKLIYSKQPKRVSLCGQSLGASIANILGFYIGKNHYPNDMSKVEILAIGSPQVGDYNFQQSLARYTNTRNLIFTGTDNDQNPFEEIMNMHLEIGDFVTQIPFPCVNSPNCPSVTTINGIGSTDDYFHYHSNQGLVILHPQNLRNPSSWQREANWMLDSSVGEPGMETCHMCSYMCWMAEGSDDDGSLCYMNRDVDENAPGYVPGMHICDI